MEKKSFKKITKNRLKNIGLFYLERFESSVQNLRDVLKRRVQKYAHANPDFKKEEAYEWIEEILSEFQSAGYLSNERFANLKIKDYLNAGKSARYIKTKLKIKGIDENKIKEILDRENYDPEKSALRFCLKKKIGPYRENDEKRNEYRQKDLGAVVRAGFDYDVAVKVLNMKIEDN